MMSLLSLVLRLVDKIESFDSPKPVALRTDGHRSRTGVTQLPLGKQTLSVLYSYFLILSLVLYLRYHQ
jgi:hypothetical protein